MLMRKNIPQFVLPSGLKILDSHMFKLKNGIPVHFINGGTQDVVKIDFVFPAGLVQASKSLVASFTNHLMQEGTASMSSMDVAEKIDYYGAYLGQATNYHHAQITLYALSKYLPDLLPVVEEVLKYPAFSEHEFEVFLAKKKQNFMMDSEKVKTLAYRKSQEVLFGEDHPYGKVAKLHHYDEITLDDIKAFHQSQYISNQCTILVAGQPGEELETMLNKFFGGDDWERNSVKEKSNPQVNSAKGQVHIEKKEGAVQSALKIVRLGITKSHPDYLSLLVLNTIFGGYFGSRLMMNLREEKGLTYGISSYLISYINEGVIGVSTEVLAEKRELAVEEIFKEMDKLCTDLIEQEELDRVKNFMLGDLLRNLDGPFAVSDAFRALMGFDLDFSYFKELEETILTITAEDLRVLANKYYKKDEFYVVVAGK
jgi:predicted Zn-dependent peptidase